MIYFTSDLHFSHDREFIWGPRGFKSSWDHDETIIKNWNNLITEEDDVYILGDLMLGDNAAGIKKLARLRGKLHIIWGNHDTEPRKQLYETLHNVVEVLGYAAMIKYNGYTFYLSHFPTMVGNFDNKKKFFCLHGHTHDLDALKMVSDSCFNINLDAHNNFPINIEKIINEINCFGH